MSVRIHHRTDFFTYKLIKSDGTVFYIGMSTARRGMKWRLYGHISEARSGVKSPKCDVIREMLANGEEVGYIIDREGLTYNEGLDQERELIKIYGRENLTNRTSGGKAPYELAFTEKQLKYYQRGRNKRYMLEETNPSQSTEQYYTIKGYSADHTQDAYIHNMDGMVNWNSNGIEYNSSDWKLLEHAVDLVERGEKGDKEEAISLFKSIFGERNVFLKDE